MSASHSLDQMMATAAMGNAIYSQTYLVISKRQLPTSVPAHFLRHERVNAARDIPQSVGSRKLQVSLTVSWPSAADLQEVF